MANDTRTYRFTLTVDVEPGHPAYDDPEWEPTEVLVQREQARARGTREQVAGNVTMGTERAMKEGRWCNRPPTGYRLEDGLLIPNDDAPKVREVFLLRAEDHSHRAIAERTGINQSTVIAILDNRAYLGEMRRNGEWWPGRHEPLVTPAEFEAAHKGRIPNRRRGRDLMSGRVVCGSCGRLMSVEQNGQGQAHYRCRHRGQGCSLPARSNRGLLKAAGLGLALLCDQSIRDAIRERLEGMERSGRQPARTIPRSGADRIAELRDQRSKLLALHYGGHISADQFGEEQAHITTELEALEADANRQAAAQAEADDMLLRFDQLLALLDSIDVAALWDHATDPERRTLLDELLASVTVHDDRLVVSVHGAPPLNVAFGEVGLKHSQIGGVGGGT